MTEPSVQYEMKFIMHASPFQDILNHEFYCGKIYSPTCLIDDITSEY